MYVAFHDGISLSGNGGHVKSDAKILLIIQLITTESGQTPYTPAPRVLRAVKSRRSMQALRAQASRRR